jgi:hypothetical protein
LFCWNWKRVPCRLTCFVSLQARAVRNLWVGGISPSVSKEEVEEEFQKFGKIEGLAFSQDQTSAYIDFEKLEDAISAHRSLNGKTLDGMELCVDFQRLKGRAVYIHSCWLDYLLKFNFTLMYLWRHLSYYNLSVLICIGMVRGEQLQWSSTS